MRFSNNELLEFLSGYVTLEEKDGYIFPKRFTPKQLKIAEERGFFPRPNSTSSMFFEFVTDASEIKFDYVVFKGSSKEYFSIDVLEDGINTFNYHNDLAIEKGTMIIPLEKQGKRKVTIYLPNLAGLGIKNFELNGNIERVTRKRTLLALGDSITQGYTTNHPYLTYVNMVALAIDASVLNQGIGGDVFYADNLDETLQFDPDIITVAYGTNVEQVKTLLLGMVQNDARVAKDPAPFCRLTEWGDSSLNFTLRVWTKSGDFWNVKFDLLENILTVKKEIF